MGRTVMVVGAGLGGLRAAEKLRSAGYDEHIVVVGEEVHAPYNRPPLTKEALRTGVSHETLAYRQRSSTSDVEWRLGRRVVRADLAARTVTLDDDTLLAYDGLVIATGVVARRLDLDAPLAWRHTIRTIEDATALHTQLVDGVQVVVIGAGFIGCEVAATARALGCGVTVVEPFATPLERVAGTLVGSEVLRRHESNGVRFHLGRTVVAIEGAGGPTAVLLDDGTRVDATVVVEAVGSVAVTDWLAGQGLDLTNGVLCDVDLHPLTSAGPLRDVVVVGDVARFPNPLFGEVAHRIEHWTMPTDTAARAASSLVAGMSGEPETDPPAFAPLPTFWSDQYGARIQSFGMPHLGLGHVRVLEGDLADQAAVGYHRDGALVGVVLFGLPRQMLHYRQAVLDAAIGARTGGQAR